MSILSRYQLEHFLVLLENKPIVLIDFCKLAFDYLSAGPNEEKYLSTSKKYNIELKCIQQAVEGLVWFLVKCSKEKISKENLEYLKEIGFSNEHIEILWQFVSSKREFMEKMLKTTGVLEYRFRDLEWRLEGKIASRSLLKQANPSITLKFHLDAEAVTECKTALGDLVDRNQGNKKKEVLLQTDPNNLVHLINSLEQALVEAKTNRKTNCK